MMTKIKIKSIHTIPVNLSPLGGGVLGSSRPGRATSACQSLLTGTSGLPERCMCEKLASQAEQLAGQWELTEAPAMLAPQQQPGPPLAPSQSQWDKTAQIWGVLWGQGSSGYSLLPSSILCSAASCGYLLGSRTLLSGGLVGAVLHHL